jgi:hypothetical protein
METPPPDSASSAPPLPPTSGDSVFVVTPPLPAQEGAGRRVSTKDPFLRAFVCSGVLYAFIVGPFVFGGEPDVAFRCGYSAPACFVAALGTGFWNRAEKETWHWWRVIATVLGIWLAFNLIGFNGQTRHR